MRMMRKGMLLGLASVAWRNRATIEQKVRSMTQNQSMAQNQRSPQRR